MIAAIVVFVFLHTAEITTEIVRQGYLKWLY